MSAAGPLLSIGLPVFNGEPYLELALEAIQASTFGDFELIISDNASTDRTAEICQEFAARDVRIRYSRSRRNQGAAWNYNRVFEFSRGKYFKWAAHDDLVHPDFLRQCLEALEADPGLVGCYSKAMRIDDEGRPQGVYDNFEMRVSSPVPHERFEDLILKVHHCIAVFGVIRRDALARTPKIADYVGSDRILIAELSLLGRLYEIPKLLFYRRDHPQSSVRVFDPYQRLQWFNPDKRWRLHLPNWRKGFELLKAVLRAPIGFGEKLNCAKAVLHWFRRNRRLLRQDLKVLATRNLRTGLGQGAQSLRR